MNEWINDKAVCRTAPATLGLSNISVHWTCDIGLYSRRYKETRKKLQIWKMERFHFGCLLRRQWTLSWGIDSQAREILISSYWMEFTHTFNVSFHCLMKICPAYYRIQSVHWKYQISLFIHQETKKHGKHNCYEKWKALALGWEDSEHFPEGLLLVAWEQFNSFLMDGIVNETS